MKPFPYQPAFPSSLENGAMWRGLSVEQYVYVHIYSAMMGNPAWSPFTTPEIAESALAAARECLRGMPE